MCVWEEYINSQKQTPSGKNRSSISNKSNEYAEMSGIDGELFEFEWHIFQGFTSIEILRQIQKDLDARQRNPDQFEEEFFHVDFILWS